MSKAHNLLRRVIWVKLANCKWLFETENIDRFLIKWCFYDFLGNFIWYQSSLNKSTAQISVTAESVVDLAEQFEFRPIRSSKFQINQPVAFKIQIVQLILMY